VLVCAFVCITYICVCACVYACICICMYVCMHFLLLCIVMMFCSIAVFVFAAYEPVTSILFSRLGTKTLSIAW